MAVTIVLLALTAPAQTSTPGERTQTAAGASVLSYRIQLADPAKHILHISVTGFARATRVQLPVWNALYQVRDFSQYVTSMTAARFAPDKVALPVWQVDKTTWAADSPAIFEYEVFADTAGPFGAQFDSSHVFLNLAEVLVYPTEERDKFSAAVDICGIPTGWRVATALRPGRAQGDCQTLTAPNYDQLVDSPVEIGQFQQADFELGGARYSVVVHADPSDYDLNALKATARTVAATETEWMQDRPFDRYVFIYHFPRRPAGGGMEHAYSTAIDSSADRIKKDPMAVANVTAHEFFHLWNVKRIRPQSLEPIDYTREQYSRALWFSEGVTSTVSDYMRVRAGFIDEKRLLKDFAQAIGELESRPARLTQSVEESSLTTWYDKYSFYGQPERSISYYNKGEILGTLLDLAIRDTTSGKKSLRDVFLWMNEHFAKQGRNFPDSMGVQQAAEAVTGADFQQFFSDYVAGVVPLPYDRYFGTVGLHLEKRSRRVADLGFRVSRAPGRNGVVTSVTSGSTAEESGLRAGDVIQQINGKPLPGPLDSLAKAVKPGEAVYLKVTGARGTRDISFIAGARDEEEYDLVNVESPSAAQTSRRAAWLRGESQP